MRGIAREWDEFPPRGRVESECRCANESRKGLLRPVTFGRLRATMPGVAPGPGTADETVRAT